MRAIRIQRFLQNPVMCKLKVKKCKQEMWLYFCWETKQSLGSNIDRITASIQSLKLFLCITLNPAATTNQSTWNRVFYSHSNYKVFLLIASILGNNPFFSLVCRELSNMFFKNFISQFYSETSYVCFRDHPDKKMCFFSAFSKYKYWSNFTTEISSPSNIL
jgi:hypothetical protein